MPTITPLNQATPIVENLGPSKGSNAARERAIAILNGQAPPKPAQTSQEPARASQSTSPVNNPNQVSPEELAAVTPPTPKASTAPVEGQTDTVESPPAVKSEEKPLSQQLTLLAKKERQLRAQVQEMKAKEAALAAREEVIKAKEAPQFDPSKYVSKDELLNNPWEVLNKNGLTYDQLTQQALNQPSPETQTFMNEIRTLKDEIKALRDDHQGTKKSWEDQQRQNYDNTVNTLQQEARNLVNSDPAYEMVKAEGAVKDVVKLITKVFHEGLDDSRPKGTLLSVEEAAQMIEEELLDRAVRLVNLKKVQSKIKPAASASPAPAQAAPEATKQQGTKTLTNAIGTGRPLTARERAIMAFNGQKPTT